MTAKLEKALNRLKSILPLKDRQDACSKQIKELHQQVLRSFVDKGRILTREEMGQHVSNLEDAISVLKEKDMVVFSDDGNPVGAYPFTMEEREHVVRVRGHQVHAMWPWTPYRSAPCSEWKHKSPPDAESPAIPSA